jgi:superfamily II DNA/RNA helicase
VVRLGADLEASHNGRKWAVRFDGDASAPIAIVLAPTRELAIQIELEAEKLCNASGLTACTVYGGSPAPK